MDSDEALSDEALSMVSDRSDKSLIMQNAKEGSSDSCTEDLLLSDLENGERQSPPSWARAGILAIGWAGQRLLANKRKF
jgi:hypothetical protein